MHGWREEIERFAARGLDRSLRTLDSACGPRAVLHGRGLLHFSTNNYLGLADDPRLAEAARAAIDRYGVGAGASCLVSGHQALHRELEADLADFKGAESARVFSSGYAACVGTVSSIAGPRDAIFADELVHASLIDGSRVARSRFVFYRHADPGHLDDLLRGDAGPGRRIVLTDGVFSMEGDVAPLREIADVADRHGAALLVDDAHGTGVMGESGRGTVEAAGLADRVPVRIGTLSKALGAQGGFVVGSRELTDLLLHRARSFIYSTGIAPALCAAARAALDIVRTEPGRRAALHRNAARLRAGLAAKGYRLAGDPEVPMAVVLLGTPDAAVRLAARLFEEGVLAPAIRPPTVPEGTSRIRLTPMAVHTEADVDRVVAAFPAATEDR